MTINIKSFYFQNNTGSTLINWRTAKKPCEAVEMAVAVELRLNGFEEIDIHELNKQDLLWRNYPALESVKKLKLTSLALESPDVVASQLRAVLLRDKLKSLKDNTKWNYFFEIDRHVPVIEGVMEANHSTNLFLEFISSKKDCFVNEQITQVGTSHGGITTQLLRLGDVQAVDIFDKAKENTLLTLSVEERKYQDRFNFTLGDFALLKGRRRKYLFFNNPVFKGVGDVNSMAGNDFELPKRFILSLPELLEDGGVAYMLAVDAFFDADNNKNWTISRLNDFLAGEMPEWSYEVVNSPDYPHQLDIYSHYVIVAIQRRK